MAWHTTPHLIRLPSATIQPQESTTITFIAMDDAPVSCPVPGDAPVTHPAADHTQVQKYSYSLTDQSSTLQYTNTINQVILTRFVREKSAHKSRETQGVQ